MRLTLLTVVSMFAFISCTPSEVANQCVTPTGTGTTHSATVSASETWTADTGPHVITADIKVAKGATLTVEPCAQVQMKAGTHLSIEGNVVAEGTASRPITLGAVSSDEAFGAINVWAPGTLSLAYVTVSYGGADTTNSYGAIEARGDQLLPVQGILKVDHVTVRGSQAYGISLRSGAGFTADSQALDITASKLAGLRILPRLASNIPSGTYTGNGQDVIAVETEAYGDVSLEDVVFRARGVPYLVGVDKSLGTLVVGGGSSAVTLTVEAGVTMRFKKNQAAGILIERGSTASPSKGTLIAVGTAQAPIVFTSASATPMAGDWLGLSFGNKPSATNRLEHVEIRYAGAPSGSNGFHCQPPSKFSTSEDAALSVYGEPAQSFVKNSLIADSAGEGINLAYSGNPVDFLATNTFTNIALCKVSVPRQANGSCPSTVTCP